MGDNGTKPRVLVADDEKVIAETAKTILKTLLPRFWGEKVPQADEGVVHSARSVQAAGQM